MQQVMKHQTHRSTVAAAEQDIKSDRKQRRLLLQVSAEELKVGP
jgi:hypothetical protein